MFYKKIIVDFPLIYFRLLKVDHLKLYQNLKHIKLNTKSLPPLMPKKTCAACRSFKTYKTIFNKIWKD